MRSEPCTVCGVVKVAPGAKWPASATWYPIEGHTATCNTCSQGYVAVDPAVGCALQLCRRNVAWQQLCHLKEGNDNGNGNGNAMTVAMELAVTTKKVNMQKTGQKEAPGLGK